MDELTKQAIDALRNELAAADGRLADHIEAQKNAVATAMQALHDRWQANERAVIVAADVSNRRLDNMNEFRGALSDQQANFITKDDFAQHKRLFDEVRQTLVSEALRFLPRTEADTRRESDVARFEQLRVSTENRLEAEVVPLRAKIEQANAPNWGLIISVMSVLLVLAAGLWTVVGLQISNAIEPVKLTAEQTKVALSAETARAAQIEEISHNYVKSVGDIEALKRQATENSDRTSALRADVTRLSSAAVEIETQFCGQDNLRSQIHAQDLRIQSMLWRKLFPEAPLPTDNAFYARVGRCTGPATNQ